MQLDKFISILAFLKKFVGKTPFALIFGAQTFLKTIATKVILQNFAKLFCLRLPTGKHVAKQT